MNDNKTNISDENVILNNSSKKNKNIVLIILIIILIGLISLSLSLHFLLNKKGNNTNINESNNVNENISYEIKTFDDIKLLYVNGKQVEEIKANSEFGDIKIEEFRDVLIVDETNPGPSRRLFVVDKNANATELDYKVSTYNEELISTIDSYRIEGNNLYIKANRQWGNGYIDWYCRYNDKDEIAEYEVKYEYSNGKFSEKQVVNEISIKDKYKNEDCISDEDKKSIATEIIKTLCSDNESCISNNLVKDVGGNIRYYGSNPNNYINFNDETWRIVGVFNVKKNKMDTTTEKRIKIVKEDVLERKLFHLSSNDWVGSDLQLYLNGISKDNYYYSLNYASKNQIEKAIWNIGQVDNNTQDVSAQGIYEIEQTKFGENIVGLINLSDYGYASGDMCKNVFECTSDNWLSGEDYWTINGYPGDGGVFVWKVWNQRGIVMESSSALSGVNPSVYLKSDIQMTGLGTIDSPYILVK